jgi:ribonucleoside-diphosphate reductase alpha chain
MLEKTKSKAGKRANGAKATGGEERQGPPPRAINLTDNARTVLEKRYLRRGPDGKPAETVEQMFWRVAHHVALAEREWGGSETDIEDSFYDLLTTLRFFPNSPTFTGAGTPLGQLAACFVLKIEDDMGRSPAGIFQTLRDAALIQQTGGGNGFSFSRLRPKKSLVKSSAGEATGPVGFLRVYDKAFGEIAQGGTRRGANMSVLRVDHPDIEDFITCKTDENAITNFNISVGITDAFMRAVKNDEAWELRFPDVHAPEYHNFHGTLDQAEKAGVPVRVYKTVRARELFEKIVKQAHHNGEPGVLFLDAANRENPVPHLYELEATNPCFVGSTRIATEAGLLTIQEMAESAAEVLVATDGRAPAGGRGLPIPSPFGVAFRSASPAWKTREDVPVMRLVTRHGYTVTATPNHRFLTRDRGYVELRDLKLGDRLLLQSGEGTWSKERSLPNVEHIREVMAVMGQGGDRASGALVTRQDFAAQYAHLPTEWSHDLGVVAGWLVGDGWLSPESGSSVGMVFGSDSHEALEMVHGTLREWFGEGHLHDRGSVRQLTYGRIPYEFFNSLGVLHARAFEKRVPDSIWRAPREAVIGFLQGLFTADGTVNVSSHKKSCSIRLASSSQALLQDVQLLLLNLGVVSRIHFRRPSSYRSLPDGKGGHRQYFTHANYELIIDKANRDRFAEIVGFVDAEKQRKVQGYIATKVRRSNAEIFETTVASVEAVGTADVFDLTESQTHSVIANGIVAHQCGEQFLGPFENCCLGSINLAQHFGPDGAVDWGKLRESTALATRFLDDVVTANAYVPAVPQLREAAYNARRIGLGIMGLGDLMYHASVRYGSEEAQEFAAQVMEFVRYHCMLTSIELAQTRGSFRAIEGSVYDPKNLKWSPPTPLFPYSRDWGRPAMDWQRVVDDLKQHGIRNACQTTIAPTGTIATVAGCESYGCEPVFALAYIRHVNDRGRDLKLTYTSPLFEKALIEAGMDEAARAEIVEQVMLKGSCQDIPEIPEHIRHTFVVSQDITAEEHVRMQAAMQRFVDNSLSKTVNFPETATEADVATAYMLGWELGCKGLTVYVTGSREKVVLETHATARAKEKEGEKEKEEEAGAETVPLFHESKKPRPTRLPGSTIQMSTPLGKSFVTINENGGGQPFEVFITTAKAGSETAAVSEAIGRLISYILRLASPIAPRERLAEVARQLAGIGGGRAIGFGPNRVASLPDGVARAIAEYLNAASASGAESEVSAPVPGQMALIKFGDLCPECGEAALVNEEGCRKCYACGYSQC